MLMRMIRRRSLCSFPLLISGFLLSSSCTAVVFAQSQPAAARIESIEDLVAHLTPDQKQRFDEGMKTFNAQLYADAFTTFKGLLSQLPNDALLSKLASESALNVGNTGFALSTLKPMTQSNPDDWQGAALLVRACAESGDVACRDAGMAHMLELHRRGITPPRLQQYLVERIKVGANIMIIRASLEPWGYYKVYDLAQVMDGDGKVFLRATVESGDGDHVVFAKEHPKEAAAGERSFSLDAYRETGLNSSGQRTQTHFTYKFFVGQPTYEVVRQEFVNIVNGKSTPISSRTNLVVP